MRSAIRLVSSRDLRLRGAGVGLMQAVGAQDFFLLLGGQRHEISPSIGPRSSMLEAAAAANRSTRQVPSPAEV